tara:strand:+ start:672 stop:848 length:177 start_codon:yes stop_codon:yes gene_type:complete
MHIPDYIKVYFAFFIANFTVLTHFNQFLQTISLILAGVYTVFKIKNEIKKFKSNEKIL